MEDNIGAPESRRAGRQDAARTHLAFIKNAATRRPAQDAMYVRLAAEYGLTAEEIAAASGLAVGDVRQIVGD